MSYNLLLNTSFTDTNHWKFINCSYKDGVITSNKKVFGIEQELILPNPTKLYFRWNYLSLSSSIFDVKIGIQNKNILNVDKKTPKVNRKQFISLIDIAKQEKITLHLIFESKEEINRVQIENPILVDLYQIHKSTWLKWALDRKVFFVNGYNYINEYNCNEITRDSKDFKGIQLVEGKIGSIISAEKNISIELSSNLKENHYYLAKLDYEPINEFGRVEFKYDVIESTQIDNEQLYIIFKANNKDKLILNIISDDIISYKVNLKHMLLIDITKRKLAKNDIPYLPFV